jgi:glycosyltransferase involved in cell wall biosynthesis
MLANKKNNDMNVSVILCTYNRAQFLARAIRTVLAQTYSSFELIVVDDGSTDGTRELVGQFDDRRVIYVAHDKNKGLSAARNTGLKRATGQYIAFIDSDDEWEEDKLEQQMAFLADKPMPVFLFSNSSRIKDGRCAGFEKDPAVGTHRYFYKMYSASAPSTWIVSRDVFELTGYFDEALRRFEDVDFLFRMAQCHVAAYYLAKVVMKKYEHGTNLSCISVATLMARESFYEKHKNALRQDPVYVFRLYASMGKDAWVLRKYSLAYRYFLRAVVCKPCRVDFWFKAMRALCSLLGEAFLQRFVMECPEEIRPGEERA